MAKRKRITAKERQDRKFNIIKEIVIDPECKYLLQVKGSFDQQKLDAFKDSLEKFWASDEKVYVLHVGDMDAVSLVKIQDEPSSNLPIPPGEPDIPTTPENEVLPEDE